MAGYTAANNLLGFLYVSVNSITQACMSFTSQNYGVGKLKRMDRVLADCMILSVVVAVVLGCHLLWLRTGDFTDLHGGRRGNCVRHGDSCIHDDHLFSVRLDGSVPGGAARHGIFRGADGVVGHRNGRHESGVDFWHFPIP